MTRAQGRKGDRYYSNYWQLSSIIDIFDTYIRLLCRCGHFFIRTSTSTTRNLLDFSRDLPVFFFQNRKIMWIEFLHFEFGSYRTSGKTFFDPITSTSYQFRMNGFLTKTRVSYKLYEGVSYKNKGCHISCLVSNVAPNPPSITSCTKVRVSDLHLHLQDINGH